MKVRVPTFQLLASLAFLMWMSVLVFAQGSAKAALAGTWILNVSKSRIEDHRNFGPQTSDTLVITCSGKTVRFDDTLDGKKQQPWIYITDGKEHLFAELPGGDEISKAKWKESTLVTRLIGRRTRPPFDFTDTWTVSTDGLTLTQDSTGRIKQTFVYDRQQ